MRVVRPVVVRFDGFAGLDGVAGFDGVADFDGFAGFDGVRGMRDRFVVGALTGRVPKSFPILTVLRSVRFLGQFGSSAVWFFGQEVARWRPSATPPPITTRSGAGWRRMT